MQQNLNWKTEQVSIHLNLLYIEVDLATLKSDIDKLDIDELETTPADLSNLSYVLKMMLKNVKMLCGEKDCMWWVKKVNTIQTTDTSDLVYKADYNTKIEDNFAERLKQLKIATNAVFAAVEQCYWKLKKKIEKLQTHDLGFFIGKNYFSNDES